MTVRGPCKDTADESLDVTDCGEVCLGIVPRAFTPVFREAVLLIPALLMHGCQAFSPEKPGFRWKPFAH